MTLAFYKKHTSVFFETVNGKMLKSVKNNCGDIIRKGSIVNLYKRHRGLEIVSRQLRKDNKVKS